MREKNIICLGVVIICVIFIGICVAMASHAAYGITTERQDNLHATADALRAMGLPENSEEIKSLQALWWREQEDLDIIAKVIEHEADPQWCQWEHSVAVGVVILNRVASPNFKGDRVKEIVSAPRQYLLSYTYDFDDTSELAYLAAKDAMDGNHNVPDNAYWQDNKVQGSYIWKAFELRTKWFHSTTYICCGIPGVSE